MWNWRNRNAKRKVMNQSFNTGKLNTGKMGEDWALCGGVYKLAVLLNSNHKMSKALPFSPPPTFTPSSSFSCKDVS